MADVPTNLRTFLLAQTAISSVVGAQVHQAIVPDNREPPYVWFGRSGTTRNELLNPDVGTAAITEFFSVECIAMNLDHAQALGAALRALDGYRSTFGDTSVQALFIEEQNDDYEYRTINGDEGFHTCAFTIEVHPN